MLDYTIRPIQPDETDVLAGLLYEAIYQPPGQDPYPYDIIYTPEIYIYIDGFGQAEDDLCLVAETGDTIIGAVWTRILNGPIKGFGNLDDETPEFAIAVQPEHRNKGVGTRLMRSMIALLRENGYRRASLSVDKENAAVQMYQKVGMQIYDEREDDYIMLINMLNLKPGSHEIKLVITDLDHTFMDSLYVPNAENVRAMHEAMARGVTFCACTARNWGMAQYPVKHCGFNEKVVICNGAAIVDEHTSEISERKDIPAPTLHKIIRAVGAFPNLSLSVFQPEVVIGLEGRISEHFHDMQTNQNNTPQRRYEQTELAGSVDELCTMTLGGALMLETVSLDGSPMPGKLMRELQGTRGIRYSSSFPHSLHVTSDEADKLSAAKQLTFHYGVLRDNVMCIGDAQNDADMLRWAGIGVAVGNAVDEAKQAADYVSSDYQSGGVAQAIRKYVLG